MPWSHSDKESGLRKATRLDLGVGSTLGPHNLDVASGKISFTLVLGFVCLCIHPVPCFPTPAIPPTFPFCILWTLNCWNLLTWPLLLGVSDQCGECDVLISQWSLKEKMPRNHSDITLTVWKCNFASVNWSCNSRLHLANENLTRR